MRGLAVGCLVTAVACAGLADLAHAVETLNGKTASRFGDSAAPALRAERTSNRAGPSSRRRPRALPFPRLHLQACCTLTRRSSLAG